LIEKKPSAISGQQSAKDFAYNQFYHCESRQGGMKQSSTLSLEGVKKLITSFFPLSWSVSRRR
jgi:hypothetical protein